MRCYDGSLDDELRMVLQRRERLKRQVGELGYWVVYFPVEAQWMVFKGWAPVTKLGEFEVVVEEVLKKEGEPRYARYKMSSYENTNLAKPTFSLADIEEHRPCNADKLLEWLGAQGEVAITPGTVRRAAYLDLLSCNWFAGRFLTRDACYAWQRRAITRRTRHGASKMHISERTTTPALS